MNRFLKCSPWYGCFFLMLTAIVCSVVTDVSAQTPTPSTTSASTQTVSEEERIIAEQFLDLLVNGKYEEARRYLHPVLADEWTPEVMQERWQSFQTRTGQFVQRLDSRTIDNLVLVTIKFTEVTDDAIFIFDSSERITGIDFPLQPAQVINE